MGDVSVIHSAYAIMELIHVCSSLVVGNSVVDIACANGLQPKQQGLGNDLLAVFVVSGNVDFFIVIGVALKGVF